MNWLERFEEKYIPEPMSGCWLWIGSCDKDGYGRFWFNGKLRKSHRVSYQKFVGPIPEGKDICHKCDVPSCVNPDHLWVGDARANALDMMQKGRFNWNGKYIFIQQRKMTHCKNGHEFTPKNTYRISRDGGKRRHCRACNLEAVRRYQKRKNAHGSLKLRFEKYERWWTR